MYSKDDEDVLDYFFTNLDKDVFAAKNFHPEVWALMQARYSRAADGLRQSFLKLLKEDPNNFENLLRGIQNSQGGIEFEHATKKAINFMEKWVLGYGHSSVAEGAVIGLGLENVSILASKVIEDNRLSSYIEKSTRYVSYNEGSFYMDPKIDTPKVREFLKRLFAVYTQLHDPVLEYIKKATPLKEGVSEAAWKRSCGARRFDSIRYLLPACTKTSLGWTVNARQLAHAIRKFSSSPFFEMRELGVDIKEQAQILLPSLLKYADKNDFIIETENDMKGFVSNLKINNSGDEVVNLVSSCQDEDDVICAIIYRYGNSPYKDVMRYVKTLSEKEKEDVFDRFMSRMSIHDLPLREIEHINVTVEVVMDYGAFRDLQRHRIMTQTNPLLTTDLGYEIPQDIVDAGVGKEYCTIMDEAASLYSSLVEEHPYEAQYIIPLGYRKRYLFTANLRVLYHIIKLRTTPAGHWSYRRVGCLIYEALKKRYPLLTKYMKCHYEHEALGRLKAEERIEAR